MFYGNLVPFNYLRVSLPNEQEEESSWNKQFLAALKALYRLSNRIDSIPKSVLFELVIALNFLTRHDH